MQDEMANAGAQLPAVITPADDRDRSPANLAEWLLENRTMSHDLLMHTGGILFRGFAVENVGHLEQALAAITSQSISYAGGNSPRTRVSDKVYTSTEFPADQIITLHNELSYAQSWPARILFWCERPASSGGETPILDSRTAMQLLPPALVERFREKGLIYVQTLHAGAGLGRSWQDTFETSDRSSVEHFLNRSGIDFEWTSEGLRIRYHRKATHVHPATGQEIWFSQADQWHPAGLDPEIRKLTEQMVGPEGFPHNVVFGDGSLIGDDEITEIKETLWNNAVVFPWRRGDVLLLDNMLVAHGRRPYVGPRKVYVTMA